MTITREKAKGRRTKGRFIGIPHVVADHHDFRNLSGSAIKVLLIIARQYNGHNNGDLSAPFSEAAKWGIGSKSTLTRALRELQERGMIILTRAGKFQKPANQCALFALTWYAIDNCKGKLEIESTKTPPRQFSERVSKNQV